MTAEVEGKQVENGEYFGFHKKLGTTPDEKDEGRTFKGEGGGKKDSRSLSGCY